MDRSTNTLTVASRAHELTSETFGEWLEERQNAQNAIFRSIAEQVSDGVIEPLVGARIASCVSGSVYGYEEFHPRGDAMPAEQRLESTLLSRTKTPA